MLGGRDFHTKVGYEEPGADGWVDLEYAKGEGVLGGSGMLGTQVCGDVVVL